MKQINDLPVVGDTRFKTQYNADAFPMKLEKNTLPSETVPDASFTVKQIIERYARGLPTMAMKQGIYDEGKDPLEGVNHRTLDISELDELARANKNKIRNIEADLQQQEQDKFDKLEQENTELKNQSNSNKPTKKAQKKNEDEDE